MVGKGGLQKKLLLESTLILNREIWKEVEEKSRASLRPLKKLCNNHTVQLKPIYSSVTPELTLENHQQNFN